MCAHKRVEIRLFDCCSSMNSITKMLPHLAESLSRCLLTLALTQTVTTLTVTALTALEPPRRQHSLPHSFSRCIFMSQALASLFELPTWL